MACGKKLVNANKNELIGFIPLLPLFASFRSLTHAHDLVLFCPSPISPIKLSFTFFNDQSKSQHRHPSNIHGRCCPLFESVIAAWLCLCNSITSFQYTSYCIHDYTSLFFWSLIRLLYNDSFDFSFVVTMEWREKPGNFFALSLHCNRTALLLGLLSVIDVLCIIHYAVIVHFFKVLFIRHSLQANENKKKLCKFR